MVIPEREKCLLKGFASALKLVPTWGYAGIFTHLHRARVNDVATESISTKWHNKPPPVLSPIPILRCALFRILVAFTSRRVSQQMVKKVFTGILSRWYTEYLCTF